jgi:hypothetical protein
VSKGPWIAVVPPEEAPAILTRAYDRIRETRGHVPQIRAVMGGEPLAMEVRMAKPPCIWSMGSADS